ncbi:MAG: nucleotidyltransferase domain-containing protein [Acidobacteriota bacterium]
MKLSPILTTGERQALSELRARLNDLLGPRLERLVLFGSKARGDAERHPDTDVAVIAEGLDRQLKREILDIVTDIELNHLTPLETSSSPKPVLRG